MNIESAMHLIVERITSDQNSTLSIVFIDGVFQCFGIEDEFRINKIAGETRIPAGLYKLGVRSEGGFHSRYSNKFPRIHKGMLQIMDVPGFEYILIHIGNTDKDTAGCLVVGENALTSNAIRNSSSTAAYIDLYEKVIDFALKGEVTIEYIDRDI